MSARIAELNDLLRTTFLTGKVVFTEGFRALPDDKREAVIIGVRTYSALHSEHSSLLPAMVKSVTMPQTRRCCHAG